MAGYPTNHLGVRDLLFLNLGNGPDGRARFREVGRRPGIDRAPYDHSLGAVFTDVNGDARPDLYVANDEDPNRLYVNEPGGPLGFHFVDRARDGARRRRERRDGDRRERRLPRRLELAAARRMPCTPAAGTRSPTSAGRSPSAFGTNLTGWGDSWVDLRNDGTPELALANGAIPSRASRKDAAAPQVLTRARRPLGRHGDPARRAR